MAVAAWGGFRPGAGRKRGSATIRSRKIANELAREGLTPLQVMIETMRELCRQAADTPTAPERIEKKLAACAVAKDAAPYIHPRLTSVAATVRHIRSVRDLSDAKLAALIRLESRPMKLPDFGQNEFIPLPEERRPPTPCREGGSLPKAPPARFRMLL